MIESLTVDSPLMWLLLVLALRRRGLDITPRGNTEILAEDHLVVLTNLKDEAKIRQLIGQLAEHE